MASHKNERGVSVPPTGAKQSFPLRGYQEDLIEIAKENNVGWSSRLVDGCISAAAIAPACPPAAVSGASVCLLCAISTVLGFFGAGLAQHLTFVL